MKGNLLLVAAITDNKRITIIDYKTTHKNCSPELGDDFCSWEDLETSNKELMNIYGQFNSNKLPKENGIYEIDGFTGEYSEPEYGTYTYYSIISITKIAELPYKI